MKRFLTLLLLSSLPHTLIAAEPSAAPPFAVGPFPEKFVWPISGSEQPDPIAYSFGPRRFRMDQRYNFSRGLDIQVDKGTEVRAVVAGEVRIAGKHAAYKQPLVQLRHRKPQQDGAAAAGDKYFYTKKTNPPTRSTRRSSTGWS